MTNDEKSKLTKRYRAALSRVCALLYAADPVGAAEGNPHADEYEPEAQKILARSKSVSNAAELSMIVGSVFGEQFGEMDAGHAVKYQSIAAELWPIVRELHGL